MRSSEFIRKLKSIFAFLIPNSLISACRPRFRPRAGQAGALHIPHFSLGQQKILFFLALIILVLLYFRFYFHPYPSSPEQIFREIAVEVAGDVQTPGIYIFKDPPTLKEVIEKAGGLNEAALFDMAPSSEPIKTGTLINILKECPKTHSYLRLAKGEEVKEKETREINQDVIKIRLGRMEANKLLVFSIPLDLNRVSVEDLRLIPGIGESLAREIVTYREKRKGFRSVQELRNVKGIGEKKWKDIKPFLTLKP